MTTSRARSGARILGLALAALAIAAPAAWADDDDDDRRSKKDVNVQLLGLNDFHGTLEPPSGSGGRVGTVDAGGVEYLATHVRALERGVKHSLVVSAGDLIGGTPITSALFHDEPTIEAMNKIGLDINGVGNHEFDEGEQERRMQRGGCHRTRHRRRPPARTGASAARSSTSCPPTSCARTTAGRCSRRMRSASSGVKIGFIGMTLKGTPSIVAPSGITNLEFLDQADTANRYARVLRRRHDVEAIVVLLHEGGVENPFTSQLNDCSNITGPIVDIVDRTTDDVDLFVTGHTHQEYNCVIDGRPVTSSLSNGRILKDIDLVIDRRSEDVEQVAVENTVVTRTVARRRT